MRMHGSEFVIGRSSVEAKAISGYSPRTTKRSQYRFDRPDRLPGQRVGLRFHAPFSYLATR